MYICSIGTEPEKPQYNWNQNTTNTNVWKKASLIMKISQDHLKHFSTYRIFVEEINDQLCEPVVVQVTVNE